MPRPVPETVTPWEAAVITVSDRSARGERADRSGPAVARALARAGFRVASLQVVPDERPPLSAAIRGLARRVALVVTTGGTGLAPRDVTPDATLGVIDREIPGLAERMRLAGARRTPYAALSRAVAGTLGRALVLNLPGSPAGAVDSLKAVLPVIPHALKVLRSPACDDHS